MSELRAEVVLVTPTLAAELLASSTGNRHLRKHRIAHYAEEMRTGSFSLNGETVKIDTDGHLGDGHHRMHGVIKAGVSVPMLFVYNVPKQALETVDAGSPRNPGDRLSMIGEENYNTLSAALRWQIRYEARQLHSLRGLKLFGADVIRALEAHPKMRNAVKIARRYKTVCSLTTQAMLAFCIHNTSDSEDFWEALENGVGLHAQSPVLLLRNRLIANKGSKARLPEIEVLALIIKAYNAWKTHEPIRTLRWRNAGEAAEAFPTWAS